MNTLIKTLVSFLLLLQRFFVTNRLIFIRLFKIFEITLIIFWIITFQISLNNFSFFAPIIYGVGKLMATLAFATYVLTLTPGIIHRLQILPQLTNPIATIIILFRRQLGISMFLFASIHYSFIRILPAVAQYGFGPKLLEIATFELIGFLALLTLFPLWLTSNDNSIKILGKYWKKVQSLTYLALLLIFIHVLLRASNWAIVGLLFICLEIVSWFLHWKRQKFRQKI